jgi:hypothetical protein
LAPGEGFGDKNIFPANPLAVPIRLNGVIGGDAEAARAAVRQTGPRNSTGKHAMKRTLVRYKTKPEKAQENERLIEQVFQELRAKSPQGVRYLALKLGDGTFVHFASVEDGASSVTTLETFRSFQSGIKERCVEQPQAGDAAIVGNYRMLSE